MLECPQCGVPVEIPRAAFFVPGTYTLTCRNGHNKPLEAVFRPAERASDARHT